jgi:hypothetical protein
MPLAVSILDETTTGERRSAGVLQCDTATLTLREIIRLRVKQEVERFNATEQEIFQGLIQPDETERILNGVPEGRTVLDWEQQYAKAILAFKGNAFLLFVDDRQAADLDETIHLTAQTRITFLKLVPLQGG